ncbi:MAG: non-canonical purine NTP diphosphatase [Bacteroidales bacterium]|nr:non-canonical purine NTP diphosphatase [Bacteroidales bacterium]
MKELVFATNNPHKLKEIREIIGNKFQILNLVDIGCNEEIPEDAATLEGNASLKSWYVWNKYGKDCFADDTGLEIETLEGKPGVKSARYAGEDCIPANNILKVLDELEGKIDRKARFRTVISLIINGIEVQFEGTVEGTILHEKRGKEGFGYDPVFLPDGFNLSFAEMSPEEKNNISHRARATQKLIDHLKRSSQLPKTNPAG